jgi:hypothetical protein
MGEFTKTKGVIHMWGIALGVCILFGSGLVPEEVVIVFLSVFALRCPKENLRG